ncbi:hypothetical protein ABZ826_35065 [Streptomyces sp. NPDC047515]|uniref:hypothetical protein n=1 Tax=Streptomyces sp. NPDC047515 TaxID=3155380 RepID=UPI0033F6CB2B
MLSAVAPGPGVRRLVITLLLGLATVAVAHVLMCGVQAQDGHHVTPISGPLSATAPEARGMEHMGDTEESAGCDASESGHHPAAPGGCCDSAAFLGEVSTRSVLPLLEALLLTLAAWGLMESGLSGLAHRPRGLAVVGASLPTGCALLRLVCVSRT